MLLSLINNLLVQWRQRQLVMGVTLDQICQQSCTSMVSDNWGQLHEFIAQYMYIMLYDSLVL